MKKLIILFCVLASFTACQYEFIEVKVIPPPDPNVELSFLNDIAPIFNTDSKCTVCHYTGKTAPDLTTANAYQSLTNGSFVVINNPANSLIYTYPSPNATTHRWEFYTTNEAELIYTWINQGAKNN